MDTLTALYEAFIDVTKDIALAKRDSNHAEVKRLEAVRELIRQAMPDGNKAKRIDIKPYQEKTA